MMQSFSTEENKKAAIYTAVICGILLLLFIFIRWSDLPPTIPVVEDQIEINLGNDEEGFGEEQPLVKGTPSNAKEENTPTTPDESSSDKITPPSDNNDADAAPVVKNEKLNTKPIIEKPKVVQPEKTATTQTPKFTMNASNSSTKNGNNTDEDNSFTSQGKNPDKTGDSGSPNGSKTGGATGGPKVTKGNRKIIKHYKFEGELNKATIYAIIKVSASGQGKFVGFDKGSTSRSQAYANAVSNYLGNIQFDASDNESTVTVQFVFDVN
jgi:outer membrane biosynthesis protein TonB